MHVFSTQPATNPKRSSLDCPREAFSSSLASALAFAARALSFDVLDLTLEDFLDTVESHEPE